MHLGMTKCRIPQLGHYDLELDFYDIVSRNCIESGASSPIFFEIGIPNLVFKCILR